MSLAGCATHRVELDPTPLVSPKVEGASAGRSVFSDDQVDGPAWWEAFNSGPLNSLAQQALDKNFDVTAARERLVQAQALYRKAGGGLWPQLEATGSYERDVAAHRRTQRDEVVEAGLGLGWEVDLFRRLGSIRLTKAAEMETRKHLFDAVRLGLSVSVSEAYYGIVEQRRLLDLIEKQRQASADLLRIIERRYEQGLVSRLDVLQQRAQLAEVQSQIPSAEALLQELQNQLGALLSDLPAKTDMTQIGKDAGFPELADLSRLGSADELLRRRPDLRAAQADLVAADADTARALAERLPRLTLSADALWIEGRGAGGSFLSVGADIVQPLLDWGQRREEWRRSQSVYRERLMSFSQAYVRAVWSVETLVQGEAKQKELLKRLQERRVLLDATLGLATNRYTSGLTDYLPVLSAMQQLYALEQRLIREQRRLTSLRIALYQSLGGPLPRIQVEEAAARQGKRNS